MLFFFLFFLELDKPGHYKPLLYFATSCIMILLLQKKSTYILHRKNNMRSEQHEGQQIMTEFSNVCPLALGTEISMSSMKIMMVQTPDKALYGLTGPDHSTDIKCVLV